MAKLIAKELTVLFWGFIYGEVFGYIVAPLSNATFSPLTSGIIAMIGAFIIINALHFIIQDPDKTKKNA